MDRLDAMRVFVAVADAGSLSAAARALKVPLPTVSRKLAQLEEHLGVSLIVRTTRKFVLTEPGRTYLESSRRLLGEIETAERLAAGEYATPKGRLHVTAPIVFGRLYVLPVALAFLKAYPEVDLRLSLVDRIVDMIEEGIDVALRIAHLADSSLIAARVGAVKLVTCAAPAYLKTNGASLHLIGHPLRRRPLVVPHRRRGSRRSGALAARGHDRGSRHRRGDRGNRGRTRAVLPGRSRGQGRQAEARPAAVRAAGDSGEPGASRGAPDPAQGASVPRFRGATAAAEAGGGAGVTVAQYRFFLASRPSAKLMILPDLHCSRSCGKICRLTSTTSRQ
jgi:DNA-binding transcriptional LysR family regulator